MVTGIEGARNCADAVGRQLKMEVMVAEGRKSALLALRQREYAAVVVDEAIAECDPAAADAIWERCGVAIPLQINFALSGAARLVREIRAALHRREREQVVARRAATAAVEAEVKSTLAGLMLHSQLALSSSETTSAVAEKLRVVANLVSDLRSQLNASAEGHGLPFRSVKAPTAIRSRVLERSVTQATSFSKPGPGPTPVCVISRLRRIS
jgi:hypothetical protein